MLGEVFGAIALLIAAAAIAGIVILFVKIGFLFFYYDEKWDF